MTTIVLLNLMVEKGLKCVVIHLVQPMTWNSGYLLTQTQTSNSGKGNIYKASLF